MEGSYTLMHSYLSDTVDELARERIQCVLGGFPGVEICVCGKTARVTFADDDDCLFAFQRHPTIDIVPGEIDWIFKMTPESPRASSTLSQHSPKDQ